MLYYNLYAQSYFSLFESMEELGEILCTLGKGRHSKVYCLKEKFTNDIIAVKTYDRSRLEYRSKEILMEKEVLLRIQGHPRVAHLLRTQKDDDYLYFFLAPLLAGSLHQHIMHAANSSLPAFRCRLYAVELVTALYFLASKGVIHRDIKANNVMLNDNGHIVICDFGSATISYKPSVFCSLVNKRLAGAAANDIAANKSKGEGEGVDCSSNCHSDSSDTTNNKVRRCYTVCGTEVYMAPEMHALYLLKLQSDQVIRDSMERRRRQEQKEQREQASTSSVGFSLEALSSQFNTEIEVGAKVEAGSVTVPAETGIGTGTCSPSLRCLGYDLLVDWYAAGVLLFEINFGIVPLMNAGDAGECGDSNSNSSIDSHLRETLCCCYIRHSLQEWQVHTLLQKSTEDEEKVEKNRTGSGQRLSCEESATAAVALAGGICPTSYGVALSDLILKLIASDVTVRWGLYNITEVLGHAYFQTLGNCTTTNGVRVSADCERQRGSAMDQQQQFGVVNWEGLVNLPPLPIGTAAVSAGASAVASTVCVKTADAVVEETRIAFDRSLGWLELLPTGSSTIAIAEDEEEKDEVDQSLFAEF